MILADMVLSGNIRNIDELEDLTGTFFMYKYGESFCHFLAEHYGEDKIADAIRKLVESQEFRLCSR